MAQLKVQNFLWSVIVTFPGHAHLFFKGLTLPNIIEADFESKYSKTSLKQVLKIDKIKVLMDKDSFMEVKSIAECSLLEHYAILLTGIKR